MDFLQELPSCNNCWGLKGKMYKRRF